METVTETTYSKKVKELREKKYVVEPIHRKGTWVGPDHDSSFLNDGSKRGYVVPVKKGNVLADPLKLKNNPDQNIPDEFIEIQFTEKDRAAFASELGLPDVNNLNVHIRENFWRNNTVFVDRNGLHLNLKETSDFVKFLILNSDGENISPNWLLRKTKGTYKFALVEEGETTQENVTLADDKKRAYAHFGKMDTSVEKMKDFLYVYYLTKKDAKVPPTTANASWLKGEVGRIIEDDLSLFLDILDDEDYNVKLVIQKAVQIGALERKRHEYWIPGSDKAVGNVEEMIDFLENPVNQDVKLKLVNQIELANKK